MDIYTVFLYIEYCKNTFCGVQNILLLKYLAKYISFKL